MATVICTGANCGAQLEPADLLCPACGSPRPRAARHSAGGRRLAPLPESSGPPVHAGSITPADTAGDPVGDSSACDHRTTSPGAIVCTACGTLLTSTARRSVDGVLRYRIEAPWGDFLLDENETEIGRQAGPFTEQLASHLTVSRRHASLRITSSGRLFVIDHRSANGTFRNDRRIDPSVLVELCDGDTVSFSTRLRLSVRAEGAEP